MHNALMRVAHVCLNPPRRVVQRSSVDAMVHSYTRSWPRLSASLTDLHSSQLALSRRLTQHATIAAQDVATITQAMRHDTHGANTTLNRIIDQEDQLRRQIDHANQMSHALELIASIRSTMRTLDSIISSDPCAATRDFCHLESQLSHLSSLDPTSMSRADFFVGLEHETANLRRRIIDQLMSRIRTMIAPQRNVSQANDAALQSNELLTLTITSGTGLAQLFDSLAALHASRGVIDALSKMIIHELIQPIVAYVSTHRLTLSAPIFFASTKVAMNVRRLTISGTDLTSDEEDQPMPSLEGNAMEVILTIIDFVWQQVFAAAPATATESQSSSTSNADSTPTMARLATSLAPKLRPLIDQLCQASIPHSIAALQAYPATFGARLLEFESQARARGLLVARSDDGVDGETQSDTIATFVSRIVVAYEHDTRHRVLHRTKELVINNTFDTKVFRAVDDDEEERIYPNLFTQPNITNGPDTDTMAHQLLTQHTRQIFAASNSYAISKAAFTFINMIYQLYFEACKAKRCVSEQW